jgi:LysM repeat protein
MRWLTTILLSAWAVGLVSTGAKAQTRVTVDSGDALSVLAERFGVSVSDLREWNDLSGDRIRVGQELVVTPANTGSSSDEPPPGGEAAHADSYVVAPGDTVTGIASRFGVSVAELCRWNNELDADRIVVGQTLKLAPARHRIEHTVVRGDNLARIAARYGASVRALREWNSPLRSDTIRLGRTIVVYSEVPESTSESIGWPYQGRLTVPVRLPTHRGYVIRERNSAWGTLETIQWLGDGFDAVRQRFPEGPRLRIHDISHHRGGFMRGHRSHQSGRDVDLSYYQRQCGPAGCPFRNLTARELDAARTWALFERWLTDDRIEAIFVDYRLQAPLYREARRRGATREQLHRWFQYPRGPGFPLGAIRHFRLHRDHAHVRFRCPDTDAQCR